MKELTLTDIDFLKWIDRNGYITIKEAEKWFKDRGNCQKAIARLASKSMIKTIIKYDVAPVRIILIGESAFYFFKTDKTYWNHRKHFKGINLQSIFA
jgi:predicted phage gp36 major capsid-like protein